MTPSPQTQTLNHSLLADFRTAKLFHQNEGLKFTSIDFCDDGSFVATTSDDDTVRIYDCLQAKEIRKCKSSTYGAHLARFTHDNNSLIYASTKNNHDIRYLSTHDNTFLRLFKGHEQQVVSLEMSSQDDTFISASLDGKLRIWDIRSPNCVGFIPFAVGFRPSVAYDSGGQVFALALQDPTGNVKSRIRLYDIRQMEKGPFENERVDTVGASPNQNYLWTSIKFSSDGQQLLLTTSGVAHYLIDGFKPRIIYRLDKHSPPDSPYANVWGGEASFTPDGKFVVAGSSNGLTTYDTNLGHSLHALSSTDDSPIGLVNCNSRYNLFVTASRKCLAFWLPDPNDAI